MLSNSRAFCLVSIFLLISLQAVWAVEMSKTIFDRLGIEARTWFPEMAGKINKGSALDLRRTLGMEDKVKSSLSTVFIGSILSVQSKWRFGYENYNYIGAKALSSDYDFNTIHYAAGDMVHAKVDVNAVKAVLLPTYSKLGDRNFSWLLGIKGVRMDYKLDVLGLDDKKTQTTFNAIMPLVGARFETARTKGTSYYSEISSAAVSGRRYVLDIEAGIHNKISKMAIVSAGYHAVVFNIKDKDDYAGFNLGGPFVQFNYKY